LDVGIQPRRTARPPSSQEVVGGLELSLDLLEASALLCGGLGARFLVEQRVFLLGEPLDVLDEVLVVLHRGEAYASSRGADSSTRAAAVTSLACARPGMNRFRSPAPTSNTRPATTSETRKPLIQESRKAATTAPCCSGERPAS